MRKIHVLIGACCLIAALMLITEPFPADGRGGGCYRPKGPFKQLSGQFQYDYKRYGAMGRDWESDCTREMLNAAVEAHALNPEGGTGGRPSVEFTVWFIGPMNSDNPKCTFEISGGGEVKALEAVTRHHLTAIGTPKVAGDFSNPPQPDTPWTIRFTCTSE